jgi:neutral ceramidase
MRRSRQFLATAAFFLFFDLYAAELRIGVARASLPLPEEVPLAGYSINRLSSGSHESLQVRTILLRSATGSVALVSCDLYRLQSRRVSEEAKRSLGIDTVLFASSGTHSAPFLDNASPYPWAARVEDTILRTLKEADSSMFAGRLGAGLGSIDFAYNWRIVDPSGAITMLWRNPDRKATSPVSTAVPVWRIDSEDGELRAILFSTSARASVAGREEKLLCGDYPGHAARDVENLLGERVVAVFVQGATGNLVPFANQTSVSNAQKVGRAVADEVVRAARAIVTVPEPDPSLALYRTSLEFHERWSTKRKVTVETATVILNRRFALAAIPGQPFVEHQIGVADRSPLSDTILASFIQTDRGEWAGVLPTIRAAAQGGYGAGYATRLEVGAGEAMVDAALVNIYRSIGKLDDLPRGSLVREMPPEGRPRP